MSEYQDFLGEQHRIYDGFRESGVAEEGIIPGGAITSITPGQGTYSIVLRHSERINDQVASLSERIGGLVRGIVYGPDMIHTTAAATPSIPDFEPEEAVLERLAEVADRSKGLFSGASVHYNNWRHARDSWLCNRDSVIASGVPSQTMVNGVLRVYEGALEVQSFKKPWGTHLTASRFTEERNDEAVDAVLRIVAEEPPLGRSEPVSLDVVHFALTRKEFSMKVYKSFKLTTS